MGGHGAKQAEECIFWHGAIDGVGVEVLLQALHVEEIDVLLLAQLLQTFLAVFESSYILWICPRNSFEDTSLMLLESMMLTSYESSVNFESKS